MRIYRFDEEVSLPVSDAGSRHRLGSLVAPGALAGIDVVHLPAGGRIGRQRAASLQLLVVVSGSGWVSGGDGHRRDLRTGYAALWEAGEEREAGSDAGLMAIRAEGSFEVRAFSCRSSLRLRSSSGPGRSSGSTPRYHSQRSRSRSNSTSRMGGDSVVRRRLAGPADSRCSARP